MSDQPNDSIVSPPSGPAEAAPQGSGASQRRTSRAVIWADTIAGVVIRSGGVLIIVAVVGILLFLVTTVLPLFQAGTMRVTATAGRVPIEGQVQVLALDEYRFLAAAIGEAPEVVYFRPDTSEVVARIPISGLESARIACAHRSVRGSCVALGTADGRVAALTLDFDTGFVLGTEAEGLRTQMAAGERRTVGPSVVERRVGGNLLRVEPKVVLRAVGELSPGAAPVAAVGTHFQEEDGVLAAIGADGGLRILRLTIDSGGEGVGGGRFQESSVVRGPKVVDVPTHPFAVLVDEELRTVWTVSSGGAVARIDTTKSPAVVWEVKFVGDPTTTRLTAAELLLGGRSLLLGTHDGSVEIWSTTPLEPRVDLVALPPTDPRVVAAAKDLAGRDPGDHRVISRLHALRPSEAPATRIVPCSTRRTFYVGHADGTVSYVFATNERILARTQAAPGPIEALAAGEKDDGFLSVGPGLNYRAYDVSCPHPETSFAALFARVHYEGYAAPGFEYQPSAASDEAELKLSLTKLLYGTLKATFYAMLFALPLALLGALYTSQFMHPDVRMIVKPGVEAMASLPSVVLGFIAGLVIAPAIESIVPGIFAAILGIVLVGAATGFVWFVLPSHVRNGVSSSQRLLLAVVLVALTCYGSVQLTPLIERVFFSGPDNPSGDFRIWLRAGVGTGTGVPLLRFGLFLVGSSLGIFLLPRWIRLELPGLDRVGAGLVKALAYAVAPGLLFALLAVPVEWALFGGDFRWWLVGEDSTGRGTTYDQRNSLVVGIAMGFAVIPIIYTIAEDALSAIPQSLKSAALGCGASPWQTAVRIVVPAAAPGIFSAVMIGLGRAVGETMIVLMAAGGTPIMDWSLFNGFRTLSANIATELPEAPQGSTLFRILFLTGLLLFALTFVVNTIAELVRIRFRRKFKQL